MAFLRPEYDKRIAQARSTMAARGLDALLVTHVPNACYLTGYQSPASSWYSCIVLPIQGEPIAHVFDHETGNLVLHGWSGGAIYARPWWSAENPADELAGILIDHGYADRRLGLEVQLTGCEAHLAETLRQRLPVATFEDASDLVLTLRSVKSPAEVEHVRRAARISDAGMAAAFGALRSGCTDNDLAAAASETMFRAGGEYAAMEPLVYIGPWHRIPHLGAKRRTIQAGDYVSVELAGVYQRYAAPLFRTAILGEPRDTVRRLADASIASLDLLLKAARPGRPVSDLVRELKAATGKMLEGLMPPRENYGYAVGIAFPPNWVEPSLLLNENNDVPLEVGMCFHSPLGYRLSDDGSGANFSDTWVVGETGGEPLTRAERRLLVVDS